SGGGGAAARGFGAPARPSAQRRDRHRCRPVNVSGRRCAVTLLAIVAVIVLLAVNAWFVAVEYALVAARRGNLEALLESDELRVRQARARKALAALDDRPRQLAGSQLGITVAS